MAPELIRGADYDAKVRRWEEDKEGGGRGGEVVVVVIQ